MRYVVGFLFGLLGGAVVAAALLYFNPLSRNQTIPSTDADWTLEYSLERDDIWLSTHDRRLRMRVVPDDVALLWEAGIRDTMLTAMPLGDAGLMDLMAAASRISVPSPATEFLRAGLLVDDFWLISVPGRGSLIVHSLNNLWPLLRDTVVTVDWLGRDYGGVGRYGPTLGPGRSGAAVVGLAGDFRELTGRARERVSLDGYDDSSDLANLGGQVLIELEDGTP